MISAHLCGLHQLDESVSGNQDINGFGQLQAYFQKEPESDVRKFTNFGFELKFRSGNVKSIQLISEELRCLGPVAYGTEAEKNNGIGYLIRFKEINSEKESELILETNIFVWMIDSHTEEIINFENEESDVLKRRVLLTHEMTCQRCIRQNCGCGNKNERSGCPIAVGSSTLQFFMKCNQNCQSKAGNTRNRRRFKIMVTEGEGNNFFARLLCTSQEIFIHNNSKFTSNKMEVTSSKVKRGRKNKQDNEPRIRAVIPPSGTHNQLVVINGINFTEGLQAFLGQTSLETRVITDTAISVVIPQMGPSGLFRVSLSGQGKSCSFQTPFRYITSSQSVSNLTSYELMSSSNQPSSPFRAFTIATNNSSVSYGNAHNNIILPYDSGSSCSNNFHNQNPQIYYANTPPQSPTGMTYLAHNYSSAQRNGMLAEQRIFENGISYDDCKEHRFM